MIFSRQFCAESELEIQGQAVSLHCWKLLSMVL
jgi:hypothetical protein